MQVDHRKSPNILRAYRIGSATRKAAVMRRIALMRHKRKPKNGEGGKYDDKRARDKSLHMMDIVYHAI